MQMKNDQHQTQTKLRVERIRDFFYHLVVFAFVLTLLFILAGAGAAFVLLGLFWGFGLAMHGVYAYFG